MARICELKPVKLINKFVEIQLESQPLIGRGLIYSLISKAQGPGESVVHFLNYVHWRVIISLKE